MYQTNVTGTQEAIQKMMSALDQLSTSLQNKVLRQATVAAGEPIKSAFKFIAGQHVGKKPPTRRIRGTNIVVARPHYKDTISNKVWKLPDGSGFINYVGPIAKEAPHAHWFERGPKERYTKAGKYRGSMDDYFDLTRAHDYSRTAALQAFEKTLKSGLTSLGAS